MLNLGTARAARLVLAALKNVVLRQDGTVRLRQDGTPVKREK